MRRGALVVVLWACACAHAPGRAPAGEAAAEPGVATVEAEGWAPLAADVGGGARRRALADAQRAAVEKAVGVRLTARTRVSAAIATDAAVEARTQGTLLGWTVLSERDEDGFHKTRIRARVKLGPPDDDPRLPPKVAVRLRGPAAESAESGVRRGLIASGVQVVADAEADLVVDGTVAAREVGGFADFSSWRARVSLSVTRSSTRQVLGVESREASAADPSPDAAEERAAALAGEQGAERLARAAFPRLAAAD